jgi:hypothetical protein
MRRYIGSSACRRCTCRLLALSMRAFRIGNWDVCRVAWDSLDWRIQCQSAHRTTQGITKGQFARRRKSPIQLRPRDPKVPPYSSKDGMGNRSRYTVAGVSDASVSAGRAEPIDKKCLQHVRIIFFEPVTRTPGSDQRRLLCPIHIPHLYPLAAFQNIQVCNSLRSKQKSCLIDFAPAS